MKTELFTFGGDGIRRVDTGKKLDFGSIILFKGYGKDGKQFAALDQVSGGEQKFVSLDPNDPGYAHTYVGSINPDYYKSNGIGYYMPPEGRATMAGTNEVLDAINRADQADQARREKVQHKQEEEQRLETIGRQMFESMKPAGSQAVIIAHYVIDESDSMTDYFGSRTGRSVILAWSSHTRNNFSEMRKAAAGFPETAHLADKNSEFEHRENYSMGSGYYLKDGWRHNTGWEVRKTPLAAFSLPEIYRTLGAGEHVLQQEEEQAQQQAITGMIRIEDYSPKAIVIRGDTKPRRQQLKALGAKFNPGLKGGPGWIFPKKLQAVAENALNLQS